MVFDVRKRVVGPPVEGVPEYIELDVYIPSHKLGFLYQVLIAMIIFLRFHGNQQSKQRYAGGASVYTDRDRRRKEQAQAKGVSLIIVPYWWDGTSARYVYFIK